MDHFDRTTHRELGRAPGPAACTSSTRKGVRICIFARSMRTTFGARLPRPPPWERQFRSLFHEGGIERPEAIGRSTHPRPCAETNWKTAEATSRPAGRVSKRYNWLSVRSSNCTQQGRAHGERGSDAMKRQGSRVKTNQGMAQRAASGSASSRTCLQQLRCLYSSDSTPGYSIVKFFIGAHLERSSVFFFNPNGFPGILPRLRGEGVLHTAPACAVH